MDWMTVDRLGELADALEMHPADLYAAISQCAQQRDAGSPPA